ncbi:MAG TPA: T9SS type A sorting domain-containing protein, partial [Flavisolibacter sp.]|nr:T9SS type A sorting domain-containing protein [Flavisolibacter sp.]
NKNSSTLNGIAFDKIEHYYDSSVNFLYFPPSADLVESADLDGDGKQDLISSFPDGNAIMILLNNSTNTVTSFSNAFYLEVGDGTYGMTVGDIDGDGKPDIIVTNDWSKIINIYKNVSTIGHIAFAKAIQVDSRPTNPETIKIADLNGDGKPDIIVATDFDVAVLQNLSTPGNISFGKPIIYKTGTLITSISIGDIDGDGKPDITGSGYDHSVVILRNQMGEMPTIYLCDRTNATLTSNVTGTIFQWQINKGNGFVPLPNDSIASGSTSISVKLTRVPLSWTGYQLQCIINGGQLKSSIFTLKVNPVPLADAGPDITKCESQSENGVLIGVPGIADRWYIWSPDRFDIRVNGTSQVIAYPSYTENFALTVSNSFGCSSTDTMTANIIINPPQPVLTPVSNASICDSTSAHLQSTDTLPKLWYLNDVLIDSVLRKDLFTKQIGYYSAKAVVRGCASYYVSNPVWVTQAKVPPAPVLTQIGNVLFATTTFSYTNWYINGVLMPNEFGSYLNLKTSGVYTSTVLDNGCLSLPSNSINVVLTAVNSPVLLNEITIMPNPVKDRLWINHIGNRSKFSTVIYNMEGKQVYEGSFTSTLEVNLGYLSSGLYIIQVTNDHTNEHIQKMIFKE